MAQFSRVLAATVFLSMLGFGIYCRPNALDMRREIYDKRFVRSPCGGVCYDPGSQMCCNGKFTYKPPNARCGGTQAFNPDWEECCHYRPTQVTSATYVYRSQCDESMLKTISIVGCRCMGGDQLTTADNC